MSNSRTQDDQIGEALLYRVVGDQIGNIGTGGNIRERKPLEDEQSQQLVNQLGMSIRVLGDQLYHNKILNGLINDLALIADQSVFEKLVKDIFSDEVINWGRIVVLFYAVGKLALKMMVNNLPTLVLNILDSCLAFFRRKLLAWVTKMGGWISSISALTLFSVEQISASASIFSHIPSCQSFIVFTCGIMLWTTIIWKLSKSS